MAAPNSYEDAQRAEAYAKLEFPGTYYLAFRDLPEIVREHVGGSTALDFGCGAGRSTRFLRKLGFDAMGVDISEDMIARAKARDPMGDYRLIGDADFATLKNQKFDLVLSAFAFDNIPTMEKKVRIFDLLADLLNDGGKIVNLVSAPEIYTHEWTSFSTRDYPENTSAKRGDTVRIIITAIDDLRPVEDILWPDDAYQEVYRAAGLRVAGTYKPLGRPDEPYGWVNETAVAPWVIYVLEACRNRRTT